MSEGCLSDFVAKAKAALDEYTRLRFAGVPHEQAVYISGFYSVFVNRSVGRDEDHKLRAANDRNDE